MKFKLGDQVVALDEDMSGVILAIRNQEIDVETEDGFHMTFLEKELILKISTQEMASFLSKDKVFQALQEKKEPVKRSFVKEKKSKKEEFVLEVDLHIEKLVPSKRGMNNYDILSLQTETAKRQIEFAMRNRIPKIVFIHGVGEGVLKAELDFLLGRYDNIKFQDANFQKYGQGATEVYFIQKKEL
jgi:dsDNA-specific endonuclease/ATPase MutS2